jgi:large subunit ribosomal protein L4
MKLAVRNGEGKELRTLEVDDSVFGITPNGAALHQTYVAQRNNQRAGNASTKTRGMVQGSTRKTRRQKYTGGARQGSIRSPLRVGGGTVFGPMPRSYGQSVNKKMRRLAIRSALSGKVADGQLVVIDQLTFEKPRTKEMKRVLQNVGITRSTLIVTSETDRLVLASARNLERTKVLPAAYLNVADMMNHAGLLMTEAAVRVAEELWGRKKAAAKAETPASTVKPKRARAKAEAKKPVSEREGEVVAEATLAAPAAKPPRARKAPAAMETVAAAPPARPARARAKAPAEPVAAAEAKPKRASRARTKPETAAEQAKEAAPKPKARRARKVAGEGEG